MASISSLLSEEQFLCSICLDVFTEPVSTPCGHNFCKDCIARYWASGEQSHCPLCNETFDRRPELRVNTGYRHIVENFKRVRSTGKCAVKQDEVPCDICPDTKLKALKSCLVCLASYCEMHLEPHHRVAALKRHKLINPIENLEDRMCKTHDMVFDLFCKTDQICFCVKCTEHKTHDTVPVEKECEERKAQLGKEQAALQEMIGKRVQKVEEIKHSVKLNKKDTEREIAESIEAFTALINSIQRAQTKLLESIEERQRAAEKQAEEFMCELEKEITTLQRRFTELERLSHCEDQIHLLQSLLSSSSSSSLYTKDWSNTTVHSHLYVGTLRKTVVHLEETFTKELEMVIREVKLCDGKIKKGADTIEERNENEALKKQTDTIKNDGENRRDDLKLETIQQQHAVDVTLDPATANVWLMISENRKEVQMGSTIFYLFGQTRDLITPTSFDKYYYVLGTNGFSSGRFYYEVQVKGKTVWHLGVVRESIERKGALLPCPKNGMWSICLGKRKGYKALHDTHVKLSLREKPEKIGVFVDYGKGLVSFFNAETGTLIYSFTGCNFTEKLYPLFGPGPRENGKNSAPLIISPVKKKRTWSVSAWEAVSHCFSILILPVIYYYYIHNN
ncbi:E3 ubiquitin-protein ligase TRIM39-like [Lampris incognitus]|uniref:E3 ubiquitin-protein ligase TRIM39-like n=1 Tax=Lampris incognitus TaxID=2546036 RepID=UPI0024B49A6D|nr:E3 ubiquitin-protein ligase TRIM39-like [Lampris incognitus]